MSIEQQEKDISVCSRLREERKAKGLDQQEIADALGVSIKTIGRWEKAIAIPSDKLAALASFGIDVLYVVTGERKAELASSLTANEVKMLGWYRVLSPVDRGVLERTAAALAESV